MKSIRRIRQCVVVTQHLTPLHGVAIGSPRGEVEAVEVGKRVNPLPTSLRTSTLSVPPSCRSGVRWPKKWRLTEATGHVLRAVEAKAKATALTTMAAVRCPHGGPQGGVELDVLSEELQQQEYAPSRRDGVHGEEVAQKPPEDELARSAAWPAPCSMRRSISLGSPLARKMDKNPMTVIEPRPRSSMIRSKVATVMSSATVEDSTMTNAKRRPRS